MYISVPVLVYVSNVCMCTHIFMCLFMYICVFVDKIITIVIFEGNKDII